MTKYNYSFQVWPDETREWGKVPVNHPLFKLLSCIGRVELGPFTEDEFGKFRYALLHNDITLREIERVPYHEPERVL